MVKEEIREEIEALQAIYDDNYFERPPVWNLPSFAIKIAPTRDEKQEPVEAIVRFKLSTTYPKTPPTIEIESSLGLSSKDTADLMNLVKTECKAWLGEVMCFNIAQCILGFLESRLHTLETFYESMVKREESQERFVKTLRNQTGESTGKPSQPIVSPAISKPIASSTTVNPSSMSNSTAKSTTVKASPGTSAGGQGPKQAWGKPSASSVSTPAPPASIAQTTATAKTIAPAHTPSSTPPVPVMKAASTASTPSIRAPAAHNTHTVLPSIRETIAREDNNASSSDGASASSTEDEAPPNLNTPSLSQSRYRQEFIEVECLGKGASGEVWKVRNRLDRGMYAIKKIPLGKKDLGGGMGVGMGMGNLGVGLSSMGVGMGKIQREVTTISRLVHKSIVRYFAAWIEERGDVVGRRKDDNTSSSGLDLSMSMMGRSTAKNPLSISYKDALSNASSSSPVQRNTNNASSRKESGKQISSPSHSDVMVDFDYGSGGGEEESNGGEGSYESSSDSSSSGSDESDSNTSSTSSSSDSSENSSDSSDSDENSRKSPKSHCLFIQMEYCPSTLREHIDQGKLVGKTQEVMKLLRQLLEGLTYMHHKKVIHRDLKPANIFLDGEQNIKIGDFGLATFRGHSHIQTHTNTSGSQNHDVQGQEQFNPHSQSSMHEQESLTAGIGTALYRAPELENIPGVTPADPSNPQQQGASPAPIKDPHRGYTTNYNDKADMYSLGIILFEMCVPPFQTGMERFMVLKELREQLKFPSNFPCLDDSSRTNINIEEYNVFEEIILWLVNPNPSLRPSAKELLTSSKIPARADIDSKYLREITDAVYRPNSTAAIDVLSILFKQSEGGAGTSSRYDEEVRMAMYDSIAPKPLSMRVHSAASQETKKNTPYPSILVNKLQIHSGLTGIVRTIHDISNAVEFNGSDVHLHSHSLTHGHQQFVRYLNCVGQVLVPHADLYTSYLRFLLLHSIHAASRYVLDKVYVFGQTHTPSLQMLKLNMGEFNLHPRYAHLGVYDTIVHTPVQSDAKHTHPFAHLLDIDTIHLVCMFLSRIIQPLHVYEVVLTLTHNALLDPIHALVCYEEHSIAGSLRTCLDKVYNGMSEIYSLDGLQTLIQTHTSGQPSSPDSSAQLTIPNSCKKRLLELMASFLPQSHMPVQNSPEGQLAVLDRLEEAFFSVLNQILANSKADNNKTHTTTSQSHPPSTPQAPTPAQTSAPPKQPDFTPLDLRRIGMGAGKSSKKSPATTAQPSKPSHAPALTPATQSKDQTQQKASDEETRIRSELQGISDNFNLALRDLRVVLQAMHTSYSYIQQASTSSAEVLYVLPSVRLQGYIHAVHAQMPIRTVARQLGVTHIVVNLVKDDGEGVYVKISDLIAHLASMYPATTHTPDTTPTIANPAKGSGKAIAQDKTLAHTTHTPQTSINSSPSPSVTYTYTLECVWNEYGAENLSGAHEKVVLKKRKKDTDVLLGRLQEKIRCVLPAPTTSLPIHLVITPAAKSRSPPTHHLPHTSHPTPVFAVEMPYVIIRGFLTLCATYGEGTNTQAFRDEVEKLLSCAGAAGGGGGGGISGSGGGTKGGAAGAGTSSGACRKMLKQLCLCLSQHAEELLASTATSNNNTPAAGGGTSGSGAGSSGGTSGMDAHAHGKKQHAHSKKASASASASASVVVSGHVYSVLDDLLDTFALPAQQLQRLRQAATF
eukprot:gene28317-34190_t